MFTVSLNGVQLNAAIGLYPEELILKNELVVNVSVSQKAEIQNLPFFNYETIYKIIVNSVIEPAKLLEEVLVRISNQLESNFPETLIEIEIKKQNPPLGGEVNFSSIRWHNSK